MLPSTILCPYRIESISRTGRAPFHFQMVSTSVSEPILFDSSCCKFWGSCQKRNDLFMALSHYNLCPCSHLRHHQHRFIAFQESWPSGMFILHLWYIIYWYTDITTGTGDCTSRCFSQSHRQLIQEALHGTGNQSYVRFKMSAFGSGVESVGLRHVPSGTVLYYIYWAARNQLWHALASILIGFILQSSWCFTWVTAILKHSKAKEKLMMWRQTE